MKSATHPTVEKLRAWAFAASSLEPMQDWDLVLSWVPYEDVYAELASTKDCPKANYFLALLYFIVGDSVRAEYRNRSREDIEALLSKLEHRFSAYVIRQWVHRSRELIARPERFRYEDWCAGGFARE